MINIEVNFTLHMPTEDQVRLYQMVRRDASEIAETLQLSCPPSRELSLVITKLEEAVMWAQAAIARNGLREAAQEAAQDANQPTLRPAT